MSQTTFRLLSDLHFEMHRDGGNSFIKEIGNTNEGEVLVLAGDIANGPKGIERALRMFSSAFEKVLYVMGNHEYYHHNAAEVHSEVKTICERIPNVHFLDCNSIEVTGLSIFGGTMWFKDRPNNVNFEGGMNDFIVIEGFKAWVYRENERFIKSLAQLKKVDLIISHHLPSSLCTPERFKSSQINRFFVCDMEPEMERLKPKAWLHGHTHDSVDLEFKETKILANPFGYPMMLNDDFCAPMKIVL